MTQAEAIIKFDTKWWEELPAVEVVRFQLFEPLLCMPFSEFHEAVEKALGRSVFSHEFGWPEGLKQEFRNKYEESV